MPEAFSAERFKRIMELRGAAPVKTVDSPKETETNSKPAAQNEFVNTELNTADVNINLLPEVTIAAQRKQQYFSLPYQPAVLPNRLYEPAKPYLYQKMDVESDIDGYLDSCQLFREGCVSQEKGDIRENDTHMLEMVDAAIDIRLERMSIGLECRAVKIGELGLMMEDIGEEYDDIGIEEGEKNCVKKMKKIGKKLSSCAKSSVKIGKKQMKIANKEMSELNQVEKLLQKELGIADGFGMQVDDLKEDLKLSAETRKELFNFVNDTYKMSGKDLQYCRQVEKEFENLQPGNKTDVSILQQNVLNHFSR